MLIRKEPPKTKGGIYWLAVDPKITTVPSETIKRGKTTTVLTGYSEERVRANIAIIDYASLNDRDIIVEAIAKALRSL